MARDAANLFGGDAGVMHTAYPLSGGEPEIRNQEVEIDAEVAGRFDAAAWRRVAKPLDTVLQSVHNPF